MKSKHQAALAHALSALGDGSGHEVWGPGIIGHKLWMADETLAATAFDAASGALFNYLGQGNLTKAWRARFIANMRKLAPVMLEILEAE